MERSGRPSTLRDVARRAGVSTSLVSRVLRGHESYAAPQTREAIRRAAGELSYQVNSVARDLRRGRTGLVGVVFHRLTITGGFAPVLLGLEAALGAHGHRLMVLSTEAGEGERDAIATCRSQRAAGVVVISSYRRMPSEHLLAAAGGTPLVAVNRWLDEDGDGLSPRPATVPAVTRVLWENGAGARALADHVLSLGHRRLAFVSDAAPGDRDRLYSQQRWAALQDVTARAGCEEPVWLVTEELVEGTWQDPSVTAFVCDVERTAAEVVHALHGRGIRVPQDVSVTGFGDSDLAQRMTPRLTTARMPLEESGRAAGDLLVRLIGGEAVRPVTLLPCSLLVRESTARPALHGPPSAAAGPPDTRGG